MSCSVNSRVRLRSAAIRCSSAIGSRVSLADMPAVGSSRSRSSGSPASAMPARAASGRRARASGPRRRALSSKADVGEQRLGLGADRVRRRGPEVAPAAAVREQRRLHVLEHRQLRKDVGALERASHAHRAQAMRRQPGDVAPVQTHPSGVGPQMPGDQVEEGRLARAVRADDGDDLAGARRSG